MDRVPAGPGHVGVVVPARSIGEERFALIGELHGQLWTCIFTVRLMRPHQSLVAAGWRGRWA